MIGEYPSTPDSQPNPPEGVTPEVLEDKSVAQKLHEILQDRAVAAEKESALLDDPRIRTLTETGQLDNASALRRETATGTTEPPRVKPPKRPRKPRGTSYPAPLTGQDVARGFANEAAETEEHVPLGDEGKSARAQAMAEAHRAHWESISNSPEFLRLPLSEQRARAMTFGKRRIERQV